MSDNIPLDIQKEIIKRLSIKPLMRFRSVSKPWKSFIDSSEVFDGYGARHTHPRSLLLRYKHNIDPFEVKYISYVDENDATLTQQDFALNITDFIKQFNDLKVIGSSHGLSCLYSYDKWMFVLWNHSLKKCVGVALPDWPLVSDAFGFVVCPDTRDPTIIKITTLDHLMIFRLSSRKWIMIPFSDFTTRSVRVVSSPVVIDRCVYWVARDFDLVDDGPFVRFDYMIMSFAFSTRKLKFVDIPLTCVLNRPITGRYYISKLFESLILFVPNEEVGVPVCGVWKMDHNGSFTKLFTISTPGSTINSILGFRNNGELVMETQKKDEEFAALEIYDPCSQRISNLGIYGERGSFFMDSYKETLLLMDHTDGCVYPEPEATSSWRRWPFTK